jgi:hypothetical protein
LYNQRPGPLQRGDNHKSSKIGQVILKTLFSRNTVPENLKFTQKPVYLVLTQVCTNHGPHGSGEATIGKTILTCVNSEELLGQKSSNLHESFL